MPDESRPPDKQQPLAGIVTNASTCLRALSANPPNIDVAREAARRSIRDSSRASEVITRLRTLFSRKKIDIEPLNLNEAAREVIPLLSGERRARSHLCILNSLRARVSLP